MYGLQALINIKMYDVVHELVFSNDLRPMMISKKYGTNVFSPLVCIKWRIISGRLENLGHISTLKYDLKSES